LPRERQNHNAECEVKTSSIKSVLALRYHGHVQQLIMASTILAGLVAAIFAWIPKHFIGILQCNALLNYISATVNMCEQVCGAGASPYPKWETINAVTTWMLPLFVLIGNVQFSNFQMRTSESRASWWAESRDVILGHALVACHLLGNPIDYLFSHLEKLEEMRRIRRQVGDERVAIVCIALLDLNGEGIVARICEVETQPDARLTPQEQTVHRANREQLIDVCSSPAFLLAHTRISSTRRSAIAVIAYSIALFTSLESAMAQDSVPAHTPHTLALRVLYYWLITAVTVSSATGAFPTEYTVWAALRPVIAEYGHNMNTLGPALSLQGASYGHRRQKKVNLDSAPRLAAALLSVIGAWAFAFAMSFITPARGIGCRNFVQIGYLCAWIINFVVSQLIQQKAKQKWSKCSTAFDVIVAIPTILCLFLAWLGTCSVFFHHLLPL
jgi:hypothetical protein